MPFKCLIDLIKAPEIRISGNGLRDGYFYERHFQEVMQSPVVPDVLKHSVENMMRRYKVNASHAAHVKNLCEQFFAGLNPFVEFDKGDKRLLEIAAMLHDIGMHIDYYDHQIHGYYLIMNGRFEGLTNAERLKVAFLVGNHRVSGIKNPLKEYHGIVSQKELPHVWGRRQNGPPPCP
jgi:exopolyphosphatase/guanosine-5'-triphosphate,3'-diphosphate pyrophosphatase